MKKFKVGDKVKILDGANIPRYTGEWCPTGMSKYVGTIQTIKRRDIGFAGDRDGYCMEGIPFTWDARGLEPVNETIVIYHSGNEVIALDKSTGKKAVAKCSPDDKFDFETGAKLAFDRLMGREKSTLYNGKVVCVESKNGFITKGKIYEFKDGRAIDDNGDKLPRVTDIKTLEQLNAVMLSDFIEVVE